LRIQFDHKLDFQLEAINSIVDIFEGQPIENGVFTVENYGQQMIKAFDEGVSNKLSISKEDILENVRNIQLRNGLKQSEKLDDLDFSIEMETGERVIIVMGAINSLASRVSGTFIQKFLCIA